MRSARLLVENGRYFKAVNDPNTERLLNYIAANAEAKGMIINKKKTGLMCVSTSRTFDCRLEVAVQGETVRGTKSMNVLGLKLDSDCTFRSHIHALRAKLRSKTWALAKLRKRGLDQDKLVKAYKALIRPSVEYLVPVWSNMITAEQSEMLERQQVQALKNIFGPGLSANKMRQKAHVERLLPEEKHCHSNFQKKPSITRGALIGLWLDGSPFTPEEKVCLIQNTMNKLPERTTLKTHLKTI